MSSSWAAASPSATCAPEVDGLAHGAGPVAQRRAVDQLRHHEVEALLEAHVVERDDVGVRQRGDRLGLGLEALAAVGVAGELLGEHLHGHVAVQPSVARAVDVAHAARPDGRNDPIRSQDRARREYFRHRSRHCTNSEQAERHGPAWLRDVCHDTAAGTGHSNFPLVPL
jgi:hypothetical protein